MEKGRVQRWFDQKGWTGLLIGAPYVWLVVWFLSCSFVKNFARSDGPAAVSTPGFS
jgi:hypothetical protein